MRAQQWEQREVSWPSCCCYHGTPVAGEFPLYNTRRCGTWLHRIWCSIIIIMEELWDNGYTCIKHNSTRIIMKDYVSVLWIYDKKWWLFSLQTQALQPSQGAIHPWLYAYMTLTQCSPLPPCDLCNPSPFHFRVKRWVIFPMRQITFNSAVSSESWCIFSKTPSIRMTVSAC